MIPPDLARASWSLAAVPYENLSKIVLRHRLGGAARSADSLPDRLSQALGKSLPGEGGTCYATTWILYQQLKSLGYQMRLLTGHKGNRQNEHCALLVAMDGGWLFLDPGYLIFEPLPVPPEGHSNVWPLRPNGVELRNTDGALTLSTGLTDLQGIVTQIRERFRFPMQGCAESAFFAAWEESFVREMMSYPVLNRLDQETGTQYYWQKDNLIIRNGQGSTLQTIPQGQRLETLVRCFSVNPTLVEEAFQILRLRL